jgi:hypothetical protein
VAAKNLLLPVVPGFSGRFNFLTVRDSTIGELLGHARRGVTARHYIRRPDAALIAAADRVCSRISAALDGKTDESGKVIGLRKV